MSSMSWLCYLSHLKDAYCSFAMLLCWCTCQFHFAVCEYSCSLCCIMRLLSPWALVRIDGTKEQPFTFDLHSLFHHGWSESKRYWKCSYWFYISYLKFQGSSYSLMGLTPHEFMTPAHMFDATQDLGSILPAVYSFSYCRCAIFTSLFAWYCGTFKINLKCYAFHRGIA